MKQFVILSVFLSFSWTTLAASHGKKCEEVFNTFLKSHDMGTYNLPAADTIKSQSSTTEMRTALDLALTKISIQSKTFPATPEHLEKVKKESTFDIAQIKHWQSRYNGFLREYNELKNLDNPSEKAKLRLAQINVEMADLKRRVHKKVEELNTNYLYSIGSEIICVETTEQKNEFCTVLENSPKADQRVSMRKTVLKQFNARALTWFEKFREEQKLDFGASYNLEYFHHGNKRADELVEKYQETIKHPKYLEYQTFTEMAAKLPAGPQKSEYHAKAKALRPYEYVVKAAEQQVDAHLFVLKSGDKVVAAKMDDTTVFFDNNCQVDKVHNAEGKNLCEKEPSRCKNFFNLAESEEIDMNLVQKISTEKPPPKPAAKPAKVQAK